MRYVVFLPEPPLPATSGGRIANRNLCDGLVRAGHDVTVVAIDRPADATADPWPVERIAVRTEGTLAVSVSRARLAAESVRNPLALVRTPTVRRQLDLALRRLRPDVVVFHHTYGWWPGDVPSVLIAQNVETDRLRAAGATGRVLRTVARLEATALAGADEVAVFSEVDRLRARELAPGSDSVVVPLGVAPARPRREHQAARLRSVAFVGSFDYPPNREAAISLARLAPRLLRDGVERILVAGRAASALPVEVTGAPGIEIRSDVADMEAVFQDQDLLIVPLTNGGGVRVKILEAWALGVPVVSTSVGIEGLGAVNGADALIGERPEDLVDLVARASDPAVRTTIADGGWARWSRCHTPAAFAAAVHDLALRAGSDRAAATVESQGS